MLIILAVLPPLYLIYRIYQMDSIEKEPRDLMLGLFIFGALSTIPAGLLEHFGESWIISGLMNGMPKTAKLFVMFFFIVAWAEEGCKHFFLKRKTWNHPAFDYCFDAVVYAVVVSLGFAALENIFYVYEYGIQGALMRAVTAIPGHCIFGIFMGYYYGQAKMAQRRGQVGLEKRMQFNSLFIPIILHGFYDFAASMGNDLWVIGFFVYVIILDVIAIKSIKKYAAQDMRI